MTAHQTHGVIAMARPRKNIEVPGKENTQQTESADNATDAQLLNSVVQQPANTAEQLNAATAGATVTVADTLETGADGQAVQQRVAKLLDGTALKERNAILSGLTAQGFAIISAFEGLGFVAPDGQQLTDSLDFLALVKQATTPTAPAVRNEDGARKVTGAPVLTEHGWHVPH